MTSSNFRPSIRRGTYLSICGPDGSGKSTLMSAIEQTVGRPSGGPLFIVQPTDWWRRNPQVARTIHGEPGGEVYPDRGIALFHLADRYADQETRIAPALANGRTVMSTRCVHSVVAFWSARRSVDADWFAACARDLLRPDLCLFLEVEPHTIVRRLVTRDGANPERFDQDPSFVKRFNEAFRELAEQNDIAILDGERSPDELLATCMELLRSRGWPPPHSVSGASSPQN